MGMEMGLVDRGRDRSDRHSVPVFRLFLVVGLRTFRTLLLIRLPTILSPRKLCGRCHLYRITFIV